jgi:uncharacterized protein involved in type VI secretion and phage assembly
MNQAGCTPRYGKYRGRVKSNIDPLGRGRLEIEVPGVLANGSTTWAEPCVPLSGPPGFPMGAHFVPPKGAGVWVEFEAGDIDHPVWVGCIWSGKDSSGVPSQAKQDAAGSPPIVLQTLGQNSLTITDAGGGGITIQTVSGARITLGSAGITLSTREGASIELTGQTVLINQGALEVT